MNREILLGITGKDFTIIAASKAAMRGATILKASDDKTKELNKHTLMAFSGEAGDTGILHSSSLLCSTNYNITQYSLPNTFRPISNFIRCEIIRTWGRQLLQALSEGSSQRA